MSLSCPAKAAGCGGCAQLSLPYAEQLRQKQAAVQKLLAPFGTLAPILGAEAPLHYRCKVLRTFARGTHGALRAGLYAEGTHRVLPVQSCLLEDEAAAAAAAAVCEAAAACRWEAFDEDRGTGLLRHVVVRRSFATGALMAVLVTAQEALPGARTFCAQVRARCPALVTLVQNVNARRSSAVFGARTKVLFGPGHIEDALCGCTFSLSPLSFYQVNPPQAEQLYRTAMDYARAGSADAVLDAYCGTGTIGLIAAKGGAGSVTGVENNRGAVQDAIRNARANGIAQARFFCADAGVFLQQLAARREAPDILFLDPPRAGASEAFLRSACAAGPRRIVYVSCCPETLARDLAFLCAHGYRFTAGRPVDLFPNTAHTECVCLVEKGAR